MGTESDRELGLPVPLVTLADWGQGKNPPTHLLNGGEAGVPFGCGGEGKKGRYTDTGLVTATRLMTQNKVDELATVDEAAGDAHFATERCPMRR